MHKMKHCTTLHHSAPHCTTLHHTAIHHHTATLCNTLLECVSDATVSQKRRLAATHCNTLHHTVTLCNTLHHTATHLIPPVLRREGSLQHTATLCTTLHHAKFVNTLNTQQDTAAKQVARGVFESQGQLCVRKFVSLVCVSS